MADVARTTAQLLTLWADNATGNITAQNGRDFIRSAMGVALGRAPTVNDDSISTSGTGHYCDTGSTWYDTAAREVYWCASGTPGAAVWLRRTPSVINGFLQLIAGGPLVVPLILQADPAQAADLLLIQDALGNPLFEINNLGIVVKGFPLTIVKAVVDYTALSKNAAMQTVHLFTLPDVCVVQAVWYYINSYFTGPPAPIGAQVEDSHGHNIGLGFGLSAPSPRDGSPTQPIEDHRENFPGTTGTTVDAVFMADGGVLGNDVVTRLTAGRVTIWVQYVKLPYP